MPKKFLLNNTPIIIFYKVLHLYRFVIHLNKLALIDNKTLYEKYKKNCIGIDVSC